VPGAAPDVVPNVGSSSDSDEDDEQPVESRDLLEKAP
jgi:hypothetical protein